LSHRCLLTREPLVINPRGHISDEEYDEIYQAFQRCRGKGKDGGPPMYVIAAYNRDTSELDGQEDLKDASGANNEKWRTSVTSPEWVVLSRAVYLAKRSHEYMHNCLSNFDDATWSSIFHETPNSFKSYSVLMRVGSDFIVDQETSSTSGNLEVTRSADGLMESSFTRSMKTRSMGPKCLRQKVYRNLRAGKSTAVIPAWQPIEDLMKSLQKRFGDYAVFFYNEFCPEVIGIVWRPQVFVPGSFSAMSSEHSCPVHDDWKLDTLISKNVGDLLREISQYTANIATSVRIFDDTCLAHFNKKQKTSQHDNGGQTVHSSDNIDE
jgi:U3 small nucleolar RNA-associated protein 22